MQIKWAEIIKNAFTLSGHEKLHINEIVDLFVRHSLDKSNPPLDQEVLRKKINSVLAANVKSKSGLFKKAKKDGKSKGIYALRGQADNATKLMREERPVDVKTAFTGKAGEYAVLSELLFRGYNCSVMTVDDGLDVVAFKDNKYFFIQVKTSNPTSKQVFSASISRDAYEKSRAANTFYIIVLRRHLPRRFVNDFVVFSATDIERFSALQEMTRTGNGISMRIEANTQDRFKLSGGTDITHCVNNFGVIC